MSKKKFGIMGAVLAIVLIMGAATVWALPPSPVAGNGTGGYGWRATPEAEPVGPGPVIDDGSLGELDEEEVEALLMALDDEYKAWSVYDQVIADFGDVRPFTQIMRAEENHIAALVTLFDRYDLDVPENEWPGNVPTFDSLAAACEAGVQAEIDNGALYDELFSMVKADNPDIIQVFTSLQQASETKHLPAFERCAFGGTPRGSVGFLPAISQ